MIVFQEVPLGGFLRIWGLLGLMYDHLCAFQGAPGSVGRDGNEGKPGPPVSFIL